MDKLAIEYIPIEEVIPYSNNPRKNDKAVDIVAASINEFGFKVPIILDKDNVIVAGHTRLKAAQLLNLKEVPVIWADDLSEEQIKAFRIMDNKSTEYATWDYELLKVELTQLKDLDFNMDLTGLTNSELNKMFPSEEDNFVEAKEPKYKIQLGDVYSLGEHKLLCGDSTKESDLKILLGEDKADLVFSDPPYGVDYEGKTEDKLKIQNDNSSDVFNQCIDILPVKPGASFYICCPAGNKFKEFLSAFEKRCYVSSTIIWAKNSFVLGHGDYHYQHEPLIYGWEKSGKHNFYGGRDQTTLWNIDRPIRSKEHPTMKPIALCEKAIINSSKEGEIVLDPFGGSGSTLIACENKKRKCRMIEIDPKYASVIIERWESLTGKTAVKNA